MRDIREPPPPAFGAAYDGDDWLPELADAPETRLRDEVEKLVREDRFELPPVPAVAQEVYEASARPQTSIRELARIAHRDAFIAGRVLRLANSAWYGFREPAGSLRDAIVRIGLDEFRNIILMIGMKGEVFRSPEFQVEAQRAWSHSLACALAASMLATRSGRLPSHRAFLAGLLHDIGISVALKGAVEYARRQPEELEDLRLRIASIANQLHNRIGALVAEKWNLDEGLTQAITYHHDPESAESEQELVRVTAVADAAAHAIGARSAAPARLPFDDDALALVGNAGVPVEDFAKKLRDRLDEYQHAMD